MLVAVWSPSYRSETAPLAVMIAGMCCRRFPCTIAMLENYVHAGNLGYHLLGNRYDTVRSTLNPDFSGSYLPGEVFLRHIANETNRAIRHRTLLQIDGNGLLFLPMNQSLSESAYRFGMHAAIDTKVDDLLEQFDDVVVHLEPNGNDTTIELLDRADIVVVCLPATLAAFSAFYDRYRSMLGKCFFVFYGATRSPEPMLFTMQKLLPKHTMRCCYVEITRLMRKYMEEGRVLDYLDRFGGNYDSSIAAEQSVAEETGVYEELAGDAEFREHEEMSPYRPDDIPEYREWRQERGAEMFAEADSEEGCGNDEPALRESESVRSIRYIAEWLMQYEYPDAQGDCVLIAERMRRRKVLPKEVAEWDMMHFS